MNMDESGLKQSFTSDSVVLRGGKSRKFGITEDGVVNNAFLSEECGWTKLSHLTQSGYETPPRRSYFAEVPHVRQLCAWDCGLACVLMVLRALGIEHCDIHSLAELCRITSIWTVDLAHLLHRFSVKFSFLTVTLGANPEYAVVTFYKDQLLDDTSRVDRLFENATDSGISIQSVLVGGHLQLRMLWWSISLHSKCERVSLECLEEARKTFGTDEDILLVYLG